MYVAKKSDLVYVCREEAIPASWLLANCISTGTIHAFSNSLASVLSRSIFVSGAPMCKIMR